VVARRREDRGVMTGRGLVIVESLAQQWGVRTRPVARVCGRTSTSHPVSTQTWARPPAFLFRRTLGPRCCLPVARDGRRT
jgi:hypothetical protein